MGLSIPQVTKVFLHLRHMGLDVENVYTVEQAVAALNKIRGGKCHAMWRMCTQWSRQWLL